MITASQLYVRNGQSMWVETNLIQQAPMSLSRHIKMIWLQGMLILLPVKISQLPFHMEAMDFWVMIGLPVMWLILIFERQSIRLSYILPMWLIVIASLLSTFAAPSLSNSFIVLLKESYLFLWFFTLVGIFSTLSDRDFHQIMVVFSGVVILHGVLIIAQFLSPEIWRISTRIAGVHQTYEHFRAAGLFIDPDKAGSANKAAFFQLLGFVPIILVRPSKKIGGLLAVLLFASMLATGSMGAISAFTCGLVTAVIAISILSKNHITFIKKFFVQLVFAISLLGAAYVVISQNQDYQDHLTSIVGGRAERSSEGRFDLWRRGMDALSENEMPIVGVGPENFRVVDWQGKQLHNDLLAFVVERGLLGALGLILFGVIVVRRTIYLLQMYSKYNERLPITAVVFLAAIAAIAFESLTHQVFHAHQLWLILALQEAILFKMQTKNYIEIGEVPLLRH